MIFLLLLQSTSGSATTWTEVCVCVLFSRKHMQHQITELQQNVLIWWKLVKRQRLFRWKALFKVISHYFICKQPSWIRACWRALSCHSKSCNTKLRVWIIHSVEFGKYIANTVADSICIYSVSNRLLMSLLLSWLFRYHVAECVVGKLVWFLVNCRYLVWNQP